MIRATSWLRVAAVAALTTLGVAGAEAGDFRGSGETGFVHDRKRDCCDDALLLAAEASAESCERAGGFADYDPRRLRGSCDAEYRQDDRGRLWYSCRSTVTVRCR
jgi:hypothetical protein